MTNDAHGEYPEHTRGFLAAYTAELALAAACALSPFARVYRSSVTLGSGAFSAFDVVRTAQQLLDFSGEIGKGAEISDIDVISMDSANRGLVAVPVVIALLYLIGFVLLAFAIGALILDRSGTLTKFWHCARGSARSFLLASAGMCAAVTAFEAYAAGSASLSNTVEPTIYLFAAFWAVAEIIADIQIRRIRSADLQKQKELK